MEEDLTSAMMLKYYQTTVALVMSISVISLNYIMPLIQLLLIPTECALVPKTRAVMNLK